MSLVGLNAVECAVALQCRVADANGALPAERRIELRVDINLGDVVVEGGDLFGDGVNVAARLQEVAEPGGICVAASVRDQVRAKVALEFDDLGARQLKNIAAPVRVYRNASTAVPLPLIEKPSIAVLPFENLSGDPEQQYFSDEINENIITDLSRFHSLSVIARISSLALKTKSIKVRDVARDLGVAYVVEGSVRRAADRVRITAQLVDADTGNHLWAERHDREMRHIFALQDEVARSVASTISGGWRQRGAIGRWA